MTEPELLVSADRKEEGGTAPGLGQLAGAAAELLRQTIKNTDPHTLDFKDVKQLTGALKDLAELMEQGAEGGGDGGLVIRIEGDPGL